MTMIIKKSWFNIISNFKNIYSNITDSLGNFYINNQSY